MPTIGDNLKALRLSQCRTQQDFALALIHGGCGRVGGWRVNQTTVSQLEKDRFSLAERNVTTLADALGLPARMLLAGTQTQDEPGAADETLDRQALSDLSAVLMDAAVKAEMLGVRSAADVAE